MFIFEYKNIKLTRCAFCEILLLDPSVRVFFRNKLQKKCIENKMIFKITNFSIRFFFKNLLEVTKNKSKCTTDKTN